MDRFSLKDRDAKMEYNSDSDARHPVRRLSRRLVRFLRAVLKLKTNPTESVQMLRQPTQRCIDGKIRPNFASLSLFFGVTT